MKTIFVIVTKGLVCRNFIRCGVLASVLKDEEVRVVLCLPRNVTDDFCRELEHPRLVMEKIPPIRHGKFRAFIFTPFLRNLLFTPTRRILMRYGSGKLKRASAFSYGLMWLFYWPLSRIPWLKTATEWLEMHVFPDDVVSPFFEKYHPDLVVVLSLLSKEDVAFMKQAKFRGIPTLAMPKGWDTLDRFHFEIKPDFLALQNDCMVRYARTYHRYPPDRLRVVGFPFFDLYAREDCQWSREETCRVLGLDPSRPYLVYGSEGVWSRDEMPVVETLVRWNRENTFGPCSLVIRPYFGFIKTHPFNKFSHEPNVVIDARHRLRTFFPDGWDPAWEEMVCFVNLVRHASAIICVRSTLTLDAAMVDRPAINVAYQAYVDDRGVDSTERFYDVEFYQDVLRTGGVAYTRNEEELAASIRDALAHPEYHAEGRAQLRAELCHVIDGSAVERFAAYIHELAGLAKNRGRIDGSI